MCIRDRYNTVDSIVVGKYVGDTALAAVGTAGPILNLLIVLFMACLRSLIPVSSLMAELQRS